MRAGQLRQRAKLYKPVRSRDAIGGTKITWRLVKEVWSSIWPLSGRETLESDAKTSVVTFELRIRRAAAPNLRSDWQFRVGSRTFDIVNVLNVEERGEMWRCSVVERAIP